ncbi:cilia- and flagella-associated protein 52 [Oryzias melastigma]|uniref:Cilia- and flagella-associated protein 52 n=1 Tax=Oryzias melastigma TaxID=30732 RepID=A0A3B3CGE8_ORYME|nr:cilia- and flagella-associated protein 52 [Oryzias melastigma]
MATTTPSIPQLELEAAIGFNGRVPCGLRVHPDQQHLIYPLGCTVILKSIRDDKQEFLHGHTNNVCCISVSKSGTYIASGQITFWGFKATVFIWNYAQRSVHAELNLHKVKVESLAFSPNDKYLVSLGGQDDDSIVVWDIETKQAICWSTASSRIAGPCLVVQYSNTNDNIFVSAGSGTIRVWELDNRNIRFTDCKIGKLQRNVKCVEISKDDQFIFCGTTTGDFLKINLRTGLLSDCGPVKAKHNLGVVALKVLESGDLLVGSGSGVLSLCSKTNFKTLRRIQLEKEVTSITVKDTEQKFYAGTEAGCIFRISFNDFEAELVYTSHCGAVKDVVMPFGTSELFATCSDDDIRLWRIDKPKELLRISVPKATCNALDFMLDGRSLISAWSNCTIRVNGPESGRPMIIINDAHKMGVTAVAGTRDCKRIVSGGGDGEVRVWELLPHGSRLVEGMKKHKATVSSVKIKSTDEECVSVGVDGVCVIWDLERFVSLQVMIANTMFRAVCYHPEEHLIITSGTDKKVTYWDVYDGSIIRNLEGSLSGPINAMHITKDGSHFVTGGDDKLVKVWTFMEGLVTHVGTAHGGSITSLKICSNNRILVSTSADGGILRWKFPHPPKL